MFNTLWPIIILGQIKINNFQLKWWPWKNKIIKIDYLKWFILKSKEKHKRKDKIYFAKKLSIKGSLLKLGGLS